MCSFECSGSSASGTTDGDFSFSMNTTARKRIEIHQIEGLDEHLRGFNRHVDILRSDEGYLSNFSYEGTFLSGGPKSTIRESLNDLVRRLRESGYSRLRSRINFRGKRYLAEAEPWVNYDYAEETNQS
jgi:hypothetical protein